ncbi:Glucose/arabinose dehydrogenase, beta-propeller fold [Actinopolymorpha cephalotaxi]|uniref:Glucose/arabinose dehydrogenase n=1 Tax=Actinopolymorpha cephalotaxi TaxID=504797 RepID=A0A1I3AHH3_9ACTN|nr:PQQ-dependent sugar dehydrogenase [Actinopolymorpha cephalotaxi]NYH82152.1 glucose/arabinose dehydrogenase [Actinopolymorpha cephalotaxi]SFH49504.1 Glucose/arabinose dehydrogenase, beta-propeller fold [Actinopolymorpha cephalotaxi]
MTRSRTPRLTLRALLLTVVLCTATACGLTGTDNSGGPDRRATPSKSARPTATATPTTPASPTPSATSVSPKPTPRATSAAPKRRAAPRPAASRKAASRPAGPARPVVAGTIAKGLTTPWDLAFLPDGSALLSERDTARIDRVTPGGNVSTVGRVPGVVHEGEGGLLGLALSPHFSRDRLLYAYITTGTDNRVVRMTYTGSALGAPEAVFTGIPRGPQHHNGGRLRFGPDGYLYVPTGDGEQRARAQNRSSLGGKVLRLTASGKPAPGNPFGTAVWTYGHRNVEGLVFDPQGRLWASEFGDKAADELNRIRAGGNYGWPVLEGRGGARRGYVDPLAQWPTDDASPSGLAYADGSMWLASLRGERLWRVPVAGGRVTGASKAFLVGTYGRLRHVARAPDGSLWLLTNNTDGRVSPRPGDDRILRLRLTR